LHLILSGEVDVVQESAEADMHLLRTLSAGQFFGELGLVAKDVRTANVVAKESVTCLVLSPGRPTAFAPRGPDGYLSGVDPVPVGPGDAVATTRIHVSGYVDRKVAVIAAHRSQFPFDPDMFPKDLLHDMFGQEFFVRVHPPIELEDGLLG
jgi:hypothetical protein